MPVPLLHLTHRNPLRRALAALVLFAFTLPAFAAKPPVPFLSIPLEELGFQGVPAQYFLLGDSIFTVHFVDDTHLLATFTSRGLMTRLPDAQETDNDQNVTAVLLELPTGKVLGRTVWRERDRGQYLWALGHGRFILRVRSKLTLLNPLANLASGKPFEEEPFVELHRTVGYIALSPGADLISIETTAAPKPKSVTVSSSNSSSSSGATKLIPRTEPPPSKLSEVQINFFRTVYEPKKEPIAKKEAEANHEVDSPKSERLKLQSSGVVISPSLIDVPATADGYLDISKQSEGVFLFDFQGHGGKRLELSPFETSCVPRPHFVSATEFIAFGCRGNDDHQEMAGFNLHGDEPWVNAFPNHHLFPYLVTAPAAGRFALSRTLTGATYIDPDNLIADQISAQEVTVLQTWDGRSVFKLNSSPFQRSGQNFDLSPDGLTFAIIHDGKIQAYKLPPLSKKDEAAVNLATTFTPEHTDARISLGGKPIRKNGLPEEKAADESSVTGKPEAATDSITSQTKPADSQPVITQPTPPAQLAAVPVQSQSPSSTRSIATEPNQTVNGDQDPSQRRSPPSLYTKEYPRQKGDPKPSTPE